MFVLRCSNNGKRHCCVNPRPNGPEVHVHARPQAPPRARVPYSPRRPRGGPRQTLPLRCGVTVGRLELCSPHVRYNAQPNHLLLQHPHTRPLPFHLPFSLFPLLQRHEAKRRRPGSVFLHVLAQVPLKNHSFDPPQRYTWRRFEVRVLQPLARPERADTLVCP